MRPGLRASLRDLLGRRSVERDVAEEFEAHLAHRVDDLVADGLDPEAARARAEAEFGDVEALARACLEGRRRRTQRQRRAGVLDAFRRDAALALRQLRRSPGFAAVVILTLALGIGATATIASVVEAVVLEPLPFRAPDRLVEVEETTPAGDAFSVSQASFMAWRAQAPEFASVGAFLSAGFTLRGRGEPREAAAWVASASLLPTLGVQPALGRGFTVEEDRSGDPAAVAMLGHAFWQEAFGGDPEVLGADVTLNDRDYRIVGVLPPTVTLLGDADIVIPLGASPEWRPGLNRDLTVVARLAPATSVVAAGRAVSALATRLGRAHAEEAGWGGRVTPLRDVLLGEAVTRSGWVLMAAAALLLLIACVNVSNVLLARATTRRAEMDVRMALGAGRGRVMRQLLTESLVLAALGGAAGAAAAALALPAVRALGAGQVPRLDAAALSPGVLGVCLATVLLAAAVSGLAPALELRQRTMARGARGVTTEGGRLRAGLVAAQVALSLALVLGTGLLVRSFGRLRAVDPGFVAQGRLAAKVTFAGLSLTPDERRAAMDAILDAVEAVPGVEQAGATAVAPFSGVNLANFVAREDRMPADARDFLPMAWRVVTPKLVEALGTRVLEGRTFRRNGGPGAADEVLVSRTLARALWPEGGAVGSTVVWGDPEGSRLRVVGVVADLQDVRLEDAPQAMVFRPYDDIPLSTMTVVAHARGRTSLVAPRVRAAIRQAVPEVAVSAPEALSSGLSRAVAGPRFDTVLLATFASTGLLLALVGVYGVTAFGVSRRRREIGIRLALGGDPRTIRRRILARGLAMGASGVAAGIVLAVGVARGLSGLLFRTGAGDPLTWTLAPALLLLTTAAAAWLPARQATRVELRGILDES